MDEEQHQRAHLTTLLLAARMGQGINTSMVSDTIINEMVAIAKRIQEAAQRED